MNQKQLKLDGALYATYNFDDAGRLANIVNASDSSTITYGYDNEDKVISRAYPNGVTTTYEYYNNDLLKRLKDFNSTTTLFDRQYTYNTANQIDTLADNSGTRTFGYDNVDRLKSVTVGGTQTEFYNYDHVGNRSSSHLSSTYGYATGKYNELTSTDAATMQYDANGNTIQKSEGSNFWRYTWDGENRLTEAATRKQKVRYRYDALGRRVERNLGFKARTKFIYEGENVLIDDDDGTLTKYINGPGIDNKLRIQTGNTASYFLTDHLGSTNGLADASGSVVNSTAYDSFGNQGDTIASRYGFTGRERDDFTGLMYYRTRSYGSNFGRFISTDPIGFLGGDVNLYAYVSNMPQTYLDPFGLYPFKLPANPGTNGSNLPDGWKHVPEHKYGERWVSPNGDEGLDFHPGKEGKPGFGDKDHWHKLKPDRTGDLVPEETGGRKGGHYLPGDEVDVKDCSPKADLSQPTMEEFRLNEQYYRNMEEFWTKILVGGVVAGGGYLAPGIIPALLPAIPPLVQQSPQFVQ